MKQHLATGSLFLTGIALVLIIAFAPHQIVQAQQSAFPTIKTVQVTIGSGVTQLSTTDLICRQVTLQNNASHNMRVGDSTVTASKGILLGAGVPGTTMDFPSVQTQQINLAQIYVSGTQNDLLDVLCVQ